MRPSEGLPVELLLACKHTVKFDAPAPKAGENVYCRRCQGYSTVDQRLSSITIRCKGCPLGRGYGADQDGASRAASRHVLRTGHTIMVRQGAKLLETIGPSADQSTMDPYDSAIQRRLNLHKPSTTLEKVLQIGTNNPLDKGDDVGKCDPCKRTGQLDKSTGRGAEDAGRDVGATEPGFPF